LKGDQSPDVAIKENRPILDKEGIKVTTYQYGLTDPKLVAGKKYAWQVTSGEVESEVYYYIYSIDKIRSQNIQAYINDQQDYSVINNCQIKLSINHPYESPGSAYRFLIYAASGDCLDLINILPIPTPIYQNDIVDLSGVNTYSVILDPAAILIPGNEYYFICCAINEGLGNCAAQSNCIKFKFNGCGHVGGCNGVKNGKFADFTTVENNLVISNDWIVKDPNDYSSPPYTYSSVYPVSGTISAVASMIDHAYSEIPQNTPKQTPPGEHYISLWGGIYGSYFQTHEVIGELENNTSIGNWYQVSAKLSLADNYFSTGGNSFPLWVEVLLRKSPTGIEKIVGQILVNDRDNWQTFVRTINADNSYNLIVFRVWENSPASTGWGSANVAYISDVDICPAMPCNYIINPSFENISGNVSNPCYTNQSEFTFLSNWTSGLPISHLVDNTPDLFTPINSSTSCVGSVTPFDGNNYAGISFGKTMGHFNTESIIGSFTAPLQNFTTYNVRAQFNIGSTRNFPGTVGMFLLDPATQAEYFVGQQTLSPERPDSWQLFDRIFTTPTTGSWSQLVIKGLEQTEHNNLTYVFIDSLYLCESEETCIPANAHFILPDTVCVKENIVLDGNSSANEESYFISVTEADANGVQNKSTEVNQWFVGQSAGVFDLKSWYEGKGKHFECNKYYVIGLAVANQCTQWHSYSKLLFVSCCCDNPAIANFSFNNSLGNNDVDTLCFGQEITIDGTLSQYASNSYWLGIESAERFPAWQGMGNAIGKWFMSYPFENINVSEYAASENFNLACDNYYFVTLAVSNDCSGWSSKTKMIYLKCCQKECGIKYVRDSVWCNGVDRSGNSLYTFQLTLNNTSGPCNNLSILPVNGINGTINFSPHILSSGTNIINGTIVDILPENNPFCYKISCMVQGKTDSCSFTGCFRLPPCGEK